MPLTDKLGAIADAIRDKTGKNAAMTLDEMPGEIAAISTSTGGVSGGTFEPQFGSFTPTDAIANISIQLKDDIPDDFMMFTILNDKNIEAFKNAGTVAEIRLHKNGEFMIMRACSADNVMLAATRHTIFLTGANHGSFDAKTRTISFSVSPTSVLYLARYDYCIVPYSGIDVAGWFA